MLKRSMSTLTMLFLAGPALAFDGSVTLCDQDRCDTYWVQDSEITITDEGIKACNNTGCYEYETMLSHQAVEQRIKRGPLRPDRIIFDERAISSGIGRQSFMDFMSGFGSAATSYAKTVVNTVGVAEMDVGIRFTNGTSLRGSYDFVNDKWRVKVKGDGYGCMCEPE